MSKEKIIIIGDGAVGSSFGYACVIQGIGREIGIIDMNQDKADGDAMDLSDALAYTSPCHIYGASYSDCKDADIVVITAGAPQKQGETRLDLVNKNMKIMKSVIDNLMSSGFDGLILVASNPVDIMTYAAQKFSGLPKNRVFGSGTSLDSARFRKEISLLLNVDARNVHGYIMGEHGDSEFPAWSATNIGGLSIFDWVKTHPDVDEESLVNIFFNVKNAAYEIIKRKGATYYGIGVALARITKAILNNEHSILPLSVALEGQYGLNDIYIGIPAVVGRDGILSIIELNLNESEMNKLIQSANMLREVQEAALACLND